LGEKFKMVAKKRQKRPYNMAWVDEQHAVKSGGGTLVTVVCVEAQLQRLDLFRECFLLSQLIKSFLTVYHPKRFRFTCLSLSQWSHRLSRLWFKVRHWGCVPLIAQILNTYRLTNSSVSICRYLARL
jgi:hypothetical protein